MVDRTGTLRAGPSGPVRSGRGAGHGREAPRGAVGHGLWSFAMVIAIDGPAGAGKSTVARAVAERLGYTYLDTGAMYRCVGLAVAQDSSTPAGDVAERIAIELGERVVLDGRDVTAQIRSSEASDAASRVAADP